MNPVAVKCRTVPLSDVNPESSGGLLSGVCHPLGRVLLFGGKPRPVFSVDAFFCLRIDSHARTAITPQIGLKMTSHIPNCMSAWTTTVRLRKAVLVVSPASNPSATRPGSSETNTRNSSEDSTSPTSLSAFMVNLAVYGSGLKFS